MEQITPSSSQPKSETLDFIKRFARAFRPQIEVSQAKVKILQITTMKAIGRC